MVVEPDAFPNPEFPDACADLHNRAGSLVPEDPGRGHGSLGDLFYIGGADTADGDPHEDLGGGDAGHREGFDTEVIDPAVHHGAHRFGKAGIGLHALRADPPAGGSWDPGGRGRNSKERSQSRRSLVQRSEAMGVQDHPRIAGM